MQFKVPSTVLLPHPDGVHGTGTPRCRYANEGMLEIYYPITAMGQIGHSHTVLQFLRKPAVEGLDAVVEAVSGSILHAKKADDPDGTIAVENDSFFNGDYR